MQQCRLPGNVSKSNYNRLLPAYNINIWQPETVTVTAADLFRHGELFSATLRQTEDLAEYDIVTKTVEMVDTLWRRDQELQSRFGLKLAF